MIKVPCYGEIDEDGVPRQEHNKKQAPDKNQDASPNISLCLDFRNTELINSIKGFTVLNKVENGVFENPDQQRKP